MKERSAVVIPVVVHVVWNTSEENISEVQILSQIQVLNQDFNAENPEIGDVPTIFQAAVADVDFHFCLASKGPDGSATNGITRTQTSNNLGIGGTPAIHYSSQGGNDAWDTEKYLNIWVAKFAGGIGGVASFPGEGTADEQGVEVNYQQFGTIGTVASPPYNLGRTCTHEIGHYFNLEHVWGPNLNSCCDEDDGVLDTPDSCENYLGQCPSGNTFSCFLPDMWMNFMNYTDDACMALFSKGQKERMYAALEDFRPALLNSDGCASVAATEEIATNSLEVFGNPFAEKLIFRINAVNQIEWQVQLVNGLGQVVLDEKKRANQLLEIDVSGLPGGVYFIFASQNGVQIAERVVRL